MVNWLILLGYAIVFLWIIRRSRLLSLPEISVKWLELFFLVKALASVLLTYYFFHMKSNTDMVSYYQSGQQIFHLFKNDPVIFFKIMTGYLDSSTQNFINTLHAWDVYPWDRSLNENRLIIRLNAIISFFSVGIPYVHALVFSFLSTIGSILLIKSCTGFLNSKQILAGLTGFLIFPTVLIWTSVISKESIVVCLLGCIFYSIKLLTTGRQKVKWIIVFMFSILILFFTKSYILILLLPSLLAFFLSGYFIKIPVQWVFAGVHVLLIGSLLIAGKINPEYDPSWIIYQRQLTFVQYAQETSPSTTFSLPEPEYTYKNLFSRIPAAFINPVLHPTLQEIKNPGLLIFLAENILFLVLAIWCIIRHQDIAGNAFNLTAIYFSIGLFVLIGLSVPITGLLIRLKTPSLFLLIPLFSQVFFRVKSLSRDFMSGKILF